MHSDLHNVTGVHGVTIEGEAIAVPCVTIGLESQHLGPAKYWLAPTEFEYSVT
jgi:hypothetical protein